jgi:hypothetical protein
VVTLTWSIDAHKVNKRCVRLAFAIYIKKVSEGKRRIMETLKYFTMQKYGLQEIL